MRTKHDPAYEGDSDKKGSGHDHATHCEVAVDESGWKLSVTDWSMHIANTTTVCTAQCLTWEELA